MIASSLKGRIRGPQDGEVPLKKVVLQWQSGDKSHAFTPAGSRRRALAQGTGQTRGVARLLTSSGLALYCGVGSFSSFASFSRRFTANGKGWTSVTGPRYVSV